jgi:hypothetical protein
MSIGLCFWILMLIWLVSGITWPMREWRSGVSNLVLFIILVLVGWQIFGAPLHK